MRQRTVLVAGLVDHIMNTIPIETTSEYWLDEASNAVGSNIPPISRLQYRRARARWYELRAGQLSPEALSNFG